MALMSKSGLFQEEDLLQTDRFQTFFIATIVAAIAGLLNLTFFGNKLFDNENILPIRLDFIAFVIGIGITAALYFRLGRGQNRKVVTAFLWVWAIVMSFTIWFEGGLHSSLLLSIPILLIFAALYTTQITFLSICSFLSALIVALGLNHLYGWFPAPEAMLLEGIPRILSILVLSTFSGYVCWVFGRVLKSSFDELKSENKRVVASEDTIRKLANTDGLTGSLNRIGAESAYQELLDTINFSDESIMTYFVDLDNFKSINDLFDHDAGDQLLKTISDRLNALRQEKGFVCRFGGDEFVVVLQVPHDFNGFAIKIIESLRQPHYIFGTEAKVTASVGVAVVINEQLSFTDLCKKADMAMYMAKQSGKNQFHCYSDSLQREYMRNLTLVYELESALDNQLLDVFFQPKIDLRTNTIDGAEALLRWNRGNDENIGPDKFIPIIESTELIHSIGAWVIDESCRACKTWQAAGNPIQVAVNVSALQLTRPEFYQIVLDALERNDLQASLLEIEITEHSLIADEPIVKTQLEALKALGVSLAIDDFGTGYSNISYLTELKIDVLKLDRSFVTGINQVEGRRVIVSAVMKMAKALGMKVVAEGIETEAELWILKALSCDYGQGFLWSRAVPSSALLALIDDFQQKKTSDLHGYRNMKAIKSINSKKRYRVSHY